MGCGGGGSSSSGGTLPQTSIAPTATFDGWAPADASPLQYKVYTFNASATDPNIGGSITEFQWDMGDGSLKTSPVVLAGGKATTALSYSYVTSGARTLKVVAKNAAGLLSPVVSKALIVEASTSPLTVTLTSPTAATTLNPVIGGMVTVTYAIHVENTGVGTIAASGIFLDPGDTTATVGTPTDLGSGDWSVVVTYPGGTLTGTRTATASIKVMDSNGISSEAVAGPLLTIRTVSSIDTPPVITLDATPKIVAGTNSTYQNVVIDFKATATDADGDTLTYSWTFGETGGTGDVTPTQAASALSQSHTYATAGVYPVTFKADDGRGAVGVKTITLNLNILANGAPTITVAQVPAAPTYANVPITFTATVSDPNGDTPTLSWDFGDGTAVVTGPGPILHSFAAAGSTQVKVTADDAKGGVASWSNTLSVLSNRPPVSQVTTTVANLYQKKAYAFAATATDPDAGDAVAQYQWDFGDGTAIVNTTTGAASHTYAATFTGNASVKVRAVDSRGSTGDYSPAVVFPVLATPLPVVTFLSPGATSLNVDLSPATVTQAFTFSATNPRAGSPGVTDPIPTTPADTYITFQPNDPGATVISRVSNGGGSYTFTVQYSGASTAGTRTATPTAYATDTLGIQGLPASGPIMTLRTKGANQTPTITVTDPQSTTAAAYTSKPVSLGFTLMDGDNDPVSYTVNWGDGTATSQGTPTGDFVAGVPVSLSHVYADAFTATTRNATVTVNATDNRSAGATAVTRTRTFTVAFNALPTAVITSPQDSGATPTGYTPSPMAADTVVVPLNGKLNFVGAATLPGSQDSVTTAWVLPGGVPSSVSGDSTGDVYFAGTAGVITPNVVTYTVTDAFGRAVSKQKTVLVDGVNTQQFLLSFQYRQKSDNNASSTLSPATTAKNGLGSEVQIFQDGQSNTYNVQDQAVLTGAKAAVSIPVRSDLPFYIKVPAFSGATDDTTYLMRIPNAPTGAFADPSLLATPTADSRFSFQNGAAPFNPTLQIVTGQGFAAESTTAPQRKLDGYTALVLGTTPINNRWLDRLSVPADDLTGAFQWPQPSNAAGAMSNIPAYQLFAEWPTLLLTRGTKDLGDGDLTTTAGTSTDLGFVLDYAKYQGDTQVPESFGAFSMQAFRVPASTNDPYHLSPGWDGTAALASTAADVHNGLNPVPVGAGVPTFFNTTVNGAPGSTPLAGGLASLPLPYDPNDPDRTPLAAASTRTYSGIRSVFAYSEYLWSTVWARPLVLNSARPNFLNSLNLSTFGQFRYSNPAVWPKASAISPDNSAFDLTVRGGLPAVAGFNAVAPVKVGGGAAPTTGVGRFFWTAYTPSYSGDANQGAVISRTWLSDDTTKQPPTSFPSATASGDATVAFGFMTPQDTIVDKRGRTATGALSGSSLGGYRVTWYNPTKDASQNPVAPDFWVVELTVGGSNTHFMLPGNYPATTQSTADLILTDARTYLPSGNSAATGRAVGDKVGPGYCWFDIPPELRPTAAATLTVYGVKAILKNNPVTGARALNRPDWMDAIKTATATIKVLASSGKTLDAAHKIPFNYYWDVVVVNGPATAVAP